MADMKCGIPMESIPDFPKEDTKDLKEIYERVDKLQVMLDRYGYLTYHDEETILEGKSEDYCSFYTKYNFWIGDRERWINDMEALRGHYFNLITEEKNFVLSNKWVNEFNAVCHTLRNWYELKQLREGNTND